MCHNDVQWLEKNKWRHAQTNKWRHAQKQSGISCTWGNPLLLDARSDACSVYCCTFLSTETPSFSDWKQKQKTARTHTATPQRIITNCGCLNVQPTFVNQIYRVAKSYTVLEHWAPVESNAQVAWVKLVSKVVNASLIIDVLAVTDLTVKSCPDIL